ncbi:MAG: electron transport complex subunit E [Oscillospiraceae bacterium]|nr:electron transport complex subunit E [Oscillospiraceae bacterium]
MWKTFSKGIIRENPVLVLILGTCPSLAVSSSVQSALGMGIAATAVLICSNVFISALRNIIPDKVRIPAFIIVIAGFVTMTQMIVKSYAPEIDEQLGIFLPLIVVNCIILARAEMFASKNRVLASALDGAGMGAGFTATLLVMSSIRELLGSGTWFGISVTDRWAPPMLIFVMAPGGFFVFGLLVALAAKLSKAGEVTPGCPMACPGCEAAADCEQSQKGGDPA